MNTTPLSKLQDILESTCDILYSDAHGIYIPKIASEDCHLLFDLSKADKDILSDPENEQYWDTWQECLGAEYKHPETGAKLRLEQDGDLFVIYAEQRDADIVEWQEENPDEDLDSLLEQLTCH
jgi:hypothetical protein